MLTDQQIDIFNQHFQLTEIATEVKNPRNQGVSRFQSGEELVNSVGK